MKNKRVTLAEVAESAGVSVATVSKVLNDHVDVSPATRRHVQQHLRNSSYQQPGRDTRRSARTGGLIEVGFPRWQNAYIVTVLDGITTAAQGEGFQVVIGPHAGDDQVDLDLHSLRKSRVGFIFITADPSHDPVRTLVDNGLPVVVVDPLRANSTGCISIGATNFAGGVSATEYLLKLGHKRIGYAGGPAAIDWSQARLAGYLSALRRGGAAIDESLITQSSFSYEGGREVASALLGRPDRPTAIFAAADEIALGILEEARQLAIRIPEELSVVGFDDSFLASRSAPPLTTVAQPLVEMGQLAARSLSQMITDEVVGTRYIELATRLVVRNSTGPPADH